MNLLTKKHLIFDTHLLYTLLTPLLVCCDVNPPEPRELAPRRSFGEQYKTKISVCYVLLVTRVTNRRARSWWWGGQFKLLRSL